MSVGLPCFRRGVSMSVGLPGLADTIKERVMKDGAQTNSVVTAVLQHETDEVEQICVSPGRGRQVRLHEITYI